MAAPAIRGRLVAYTNISDTIIYDYIPTGTKVVTY